MGSKKVAAAAAVLLVTLLFAAMRSTSARSLQAKHANTCSKRLMWFMTTTTTSCSKYCRYAKMALLSAKEHSPNLLPVLLVGNYGGSASSETEASLRWFHEYGGIVYHHNLSFIYDLQAVKDQGLKEPDWPNFDLEGVYMRLDIPRIFPRLMKQLEYHKPGITNNIHQELVLYTDTDVMFYHQFDPCKLDMPEVMAIGSEMDRTEKNRTAASWTELNWNSGVLFINLNGLATILPDMIKFANFKKWDFIVMDQSLINEYFPMIFGRNLDYLPEAYNWKGYWGCSPEIVLVHWHGPKPELCLNCYVAHREESKIDHDVAACVCPHAYNSLWQKAMETDGGDLYVHLIRDQSKYAELSGDASVIN